MTIEVTFEAHASGTRVRVTGTVPAGVDGTDQLSMLRMAPQWFPRYLNRRSPSGSRPDYGRLHLALRSATPAATARWLADVFQLEATPTSPTEATPTTPGSSSGSAPASSSSGAGRRDGTDSPFVYVDDLDAHLKHVEAAGATIISPITEHGFGPTPPPTARAASGFAQSGPISGTRDRDRRRPGTDQRLGWPVDEKVREKIRLFPLITPAATGG